MPKTRRNYWQKKFDSTVKRDQRNITALKALGWSSYVVWECETKNMDALTFQIKKFLR